MVVKGHGISSCLDFVNDAMSKFNHFSVTKRRNSLRNGWFLIMMVIRISPKQ